MSEMRSLMHSLATPDEKPVVASMTDAQVLESYEVAYPGGSAGFVADNEAG
jgi:hypothetical protein